MFGRGPSQPGQANEREDRVGDGGSGEARLLSPTDLDRIPLSLRASPQLPELQLIIHKIGRVRPEFLEMDPCAKHGFRR